MKKLILLFSVGILMVLVALGFLYAQDEPPPKYVGVDKCKMCHSDKYEAWAKTRMSKAYESLVMVGEEKNEKCLPCHTTGFGKESGFKDAESTPNLKGVQCEACHGPGEKFMKAMMTGQIGEATKVARENAQKACPACHFTFYHGNGHKDIK